ncbi:MAG: ABC transporter substrate-binding protein, partial [Gorillibacterium sp.]|nr:ABC transporter substrate-binding protein [Gorillibacterium sp.]
MNKRNVMAASVLALSLLATACGSKDSAGTASSPSTAPSASTAAVATATPKQPVTITVQGQKPDKKEAIEQLNLKIDRFKSAHSNVTIKTDDWEYNPNEIGIKMASNSAPTEFTSYLTEGRALA